MEICDSMLLGYALTLAIAASTIWLFVSIYLSRENIRKTLEHINIMTLLALILIISFFVMFSILYMHPAEQLYFDENIYQGIAINILHNGNALWCQYGTGNLQNCPVNSIYHDPIGASFFLALAFGIFGTGIQTAYGIELLMGVFSIIFTFILASILIKDKYAIIASTLIFAFMPELFIWSRTQAVPNIYFLTFTILAFSMFVVFIKNKNASTMSAFLSATLIASFMRIEGILLLPIFLIAYLFYEKGFRKRINEIIEMLNSKFYILLAIFIFIILLVPQLLYLSYEISNPQYGQGSQGLFSISSFKSNILGINSNNCNEFGITLGPNICFFLGNYNSINYYPTIFPEIITILAFIGIIALLLKYELKERRVILLLLLLWIIIYYLFYGFFYAGSTLYGVDVRFMLELLPPISILAGISIGWISEEGANLLKKIKKMKPQTKNTIKAIIWIIIILILVIYPFYTYIPIITTTIQNMPQQAVISTAMNFFYKNYSKVPSNCLVFTFTPDMWYEVNRSAAQIGYLGSGDSQFKNFSSNYKCIVFDFGYWCNVPPDQSACINDINNYKTVALASENITGTINVQIQHYGFYELLNYS
jgi:hypothetical protein